MADSPAVRDAVARAEVHRNGPIYSVEGTDWTFDSSPGPAIGWLHPRSDERHPIVDVFDDVFGPEQLAHILRASHPGARTKQLILFAALVRCEILTLEELLQQQQDLVAQVVSDRGEQTFGNLTRTQQEASKATLRHTSALLVGLHGALYPEWDHLPDEIAVHVSRYTSAAHYLNFRLWEHWGSADFTNVGRNDPCPCGSSTRFKHCHGA